MEEASGGPTEVKEDQTREFFQVYLPPHHNSQQLQIPAAFIKHFNGKIPQKVKLKDLSGKCWHVNMKKSKKGLFIQNGWEAFVKDKSVEEGSFFVFRYSESSSSFIVKIFGRNGCMTQDFVRVKTEVVTEEEETSNTEGLDVASSSSSDEKEKPKVLNRAKRVPRKNPSFWGNLRVSTPFKLHVPKKVLTTYNIELGPKLRLHDENGNVWPLTVKHPSDGRTVISGGWSAFMVHNKVNGDEDKCLVEIVLGNRRQCKDLKVSIKRGGKVRAPKH